MAPVLGVGEGEQGEGVWAQREGRWSGKGMVTSQSTALPLVCPVLKGSRALSFRSL